MNTYVACMLAVSDQKPSTQGQKSNLRVGSVICLAHTKQLLNHKAHALDKPTLW